MKQITLQTDLKQCLQRSKTFTNAKLIEFNEAVVAALEEIVEAMNDALNFYEASRLDVDDDGDIVQRDENDEEEEDEHE